MGGAVTGFAKSYKRERPDALVKAVDLPLEPQDRGGRGHPRRRDPDATPAASRSATSTGGAGASVWRPGRSRRRTRPPTARLHARARTASSWSPARRAASSRRSRPISRRRRAATFHLLDLTPEPDPTDPDLRQYVEDRDGLKTVLAARMKERGERPDTGGDREGAGPVRAAGRRARRRSTPSERRRRHGPLPLASTSPTPTPSRGGGAGSARSSGRIDLLLHAAGVEISRGPPGQGAPRSSTSSSTSRPTAGSTSCSAAGDLPIGATVVFSSVAGRFGNAGQTDYSAANDLLCKITSSLRADPARDPRASPSTGPRGAASAWRPAAPSRRSWRWPASRCCRPRPASPGSGAS